MSMYKDYVEERMDNSFVHETSRGFIQYTVDKKECFIDNIYVKPEHRRSGATKELEDYVINIVKEKGCKLMKCAVVLGTNMAEVSCVNILKKGYKFLYTDDRFIYFIKELEV